ncbi:MAG: hypothetical protein H8E84_01510, partial [Flavobacteriales bacterium]|nr:hypothetical protein [Flavobacteriales bacterium]
MKKLLLLTTVVLIATTQIFAQTTSIPDANFEAYLETHDANGNTSTWPNTMGDGVANNGMVLTANINTITSLDVNNQNISDLTGIEDFADLYWLYCNNNQLSTLDLSSNSVLYELDCSY